MHAYSNWQWHLDKALVTIIGERHYLWRAMDHEGEVLESFVTKRRERKTALEPPRKSSKRYGNPEIIVTRGLPINGAATMANKVQWLAGTVPALRGTAAARTVFSLWQHHAGCRVSSPVAPRDPRPARFARQANNSKAFRLPI